LKLIHRSLHALTRDDPSVGAIRASDTACLSAQRGVALVETKEG